MSLRKYLYKSFTLPPHVVLKKAFGKIKSSFINRRRLKRDFFNCTYNHFSASNRIFFNYFKDIPLALLLPHSPEILFFSNQILQHQFNLLGSGWVTVGYGSECLGREQYKYKSDTIQTDPEGQWLKDYLSPGNYSRSINIWKNISDNYVPIDWSRDFVSGFKWSPKTWYKNITYGEIKGVDIKVPWELSRMEHLPQLVWAYLLAKEKTGGFKPPETYPEEFKNQILDFISTNPPRFGPNWACPMDVAIRVSNWLVTFDLFRANGKFFDTQFETFLQGSIYDHGLHIIQNLEWNPDLRGNHYLANLLGLLFISAYLPSTQETNRWLFFSVFELLNELDLQFHSDGSNFEGSTSYHRLSGEMAIFGLALILGLPSEKRDILKISPPRIFSETPLEESTFIKWKNSFGTDFPHCFPQEFLEKVKKIGSFSQNITKPNQQVPQIGDNDNGHFFNFQPALISSKTIDENKFNHVNFSQETPEEDFLNHLPLISAINGIFPEKDILSKTEKFKLTNSLIRQMSGEIYIPLNSQNNPTIDRPPDHPDLFSYPHFGLHIFKTPDFFLAIRCGPIGQKGNGGHSHNDQLSFELNVKGLDFIVDPGTYVYTPLPEKRNLFRSTMMHNTLVMGQKEQFQWLPGVNGLFSLRGKSSYKLVELKDDRFIGVHSAFGPTHRRTIDFLDGKIYGIDECKGDNKKTLCFQMVPAVEVMLNRKNDGAILKNQGVQIELKGGPGTWLLEDSFYSPCYGKIRKTKVLKLSSLEDKIKWKIEMI